MAKQDGPLQVDAAIALGKIGDKRAIETLAALQRSAPRRAQPAKALPVTRVEERDHPVDRRGRGVRFRQCGKRIARRLRRLGLQREANRAVIV